MQTRLDRDSHHLSAQADARLIPAPRITEPESAELRRRNVLALRFRPKLRQVGSRRAASEEEQHDRGAVRA
jgi:hypothetical protein